MDTDYGKGSERFAGLQVFSAEIHRAMGNRAGTWSFGGDATGSGHRSQLGISLKIKRGSTLQSFRAVDQVDVARTQQRTAVQSGYGTAANDSQAP